MADVNINKFRASVVRDGSKPASPGFIVSEGQDPVDPAGTGQNHLPVTIAAAATGLSITESQVLGGAGTTLQYLRGDGSLATFPDLTGYVPYTGANQTVNLNTQQLQAGHTTLTTNGSTETLTINHTSGSGKAINVTKGGNGEGLYVNKTSGSGNAATIVGTLEATTLVKTGGTSSQFLKADGSVDSTSYGTGTVTSVGLSSATSGVTIGSSPVTTSGTITLTIATASGSQNGLLSSTDWTTFNSKQPAGNYVTLDTTQTITGQKTISRTASLFNGTVQSMLIDGAAGNGSITINSVTNGYAYQTFAQGGVGKFEIGIIGTGGNGSFYINKTIQNGESGASIFIKKSDGFVGINNITPTFQLDVTGKIYSSNEIQANTAVINTTGGYATFGSNTASAPIRIGRNASSNDIIVAASGNVLIGTTTDLGFNLRVEGTSRFTNVMSIDAGAFGSEALILNSSTNQQYIAINSATGFEAMTKYFNPTAGNWYTGIRVSAGLGSTSSYHIYSSTYGNDVFVLNTDGTAKFASSVSVGGAAIGLNGINIPNQNYLAWYVSGGSGAQNVAIRGNGQNLELSSGGALTMTMDSSQRVNIGTTASTTYGTLNIVQQSISAPSFVRGIELVHPNGTGATGGYVGISMTGQKQATIQVGDDSSIGNLLLQSQGGNVGIGTASVLLENGGGQVIYNATVPRLAFRNSTSGTTSLDGVDLALSSSDFYVFNREAGSIIFGTSGTDKMQIFSDGNVFIGSSPINAGYKLNVNGTGRFTGQLTLTTASSQPLVLNGSNNQYLFISSGGAEAMTQYYNPTAENWYTGIRTSAGIGSTSSYHIYSSTYGNDVFALNTNGTARFVGNVGIGVAPATNLHVEGPTVSYGQVRIKSSGPIGGETSIHYGRTSQNLEQGWTVGQGVAGIENSFGFYTGGSVRLSVTTDGNVMIGTTTDNGSKLQVNGAIRTAQPVGTTSNGWLLGRALVSGTSTPNRWIRVQIGLEYYDILAVYMGTL